MLDAGSSNSKIIPPLAAQMIERADASLPRLVGRGFSHDIRIAVRSTLHCASVIATSGGPWVRVTYAGETGRKESFEGACSTISSKHQGFTGCKGLQSQDGRAVHCCSQLAVAGHDFRLR